MKKKSIKRLLIANRGEIATRIARACYELGITTVGIYTFEDRFSLHRYKTDESYRIGVKGDPLRPYLDIDKIVFTATPNSKSAQMLNLDSPADPPPRSVWSLSRSGPRMVPGHRRCIIMILSSILHDAGPIRHAGDGLPMLCWDQICSVTTLIGGGRSVRTRF